MSPCYIINAACNAAYMQNAHMQPMHAGIYTSNENIEWDNANIAKC